MECIICNSKSEYFFSKEYVEKPYDFLMKDIGKVEYYKCSNCGFTISKTHSDLKENLWNKLNYDFQSRTSGNDKNFINEWDHKF